MIITKRFVAATVGLLFVACVLVIPYLSLAQGIVPTCANDKCGFTDLVKLGDNLLKFAVLISVPIAAISFAYAGFLYLTAAGNSGQVSKASGIFMNVAIGLVILLSAWLIVDFILKELVDPASYINLLTVSPLIDRAQC